MVSLRLHLCCISGRTIAIRAQGLSDLSRQTRVIELHRRCCSSADLRWAVGLPFSINSTRTGPASRKAGVKAARKSPIRPAQIECRSAAGRQQQRIVAVKGRAVARDVAQFGRSALASDMPPLHDTCAQGMAREAWSAFAKRRAESPTIWHHYAQGLSVFLSKGASRRDDRSRAGQAAPRSGHFGQRHRFAAAGLSRASDRAGPRRKE